MELNKENMKKVIFIIFVTILIFWGFQNINIVGGILAMIIGLITPFILGLALAFVLNILMVKFEKISFKKSKKRRKKQHSKEVNVLKRTFTILLSFIVLILIITLVLGIVIPEFIKTIKTFAQNIPEVIETVQKFGLEMGEKYPEILEYTDIQETFNKITENDSDTTKNLIKSAWSFIQQYSVGVIASSTKAITTLVGGIVNLIIAIIFAVYLLSQKEKLQSQFRKMMYAYISKEKCDKIMEVLSISNSIFTNFITGQFVEAIILGILCFIGMLILKIPYAATVSVLIAFTALIPIVGAIVGMVIGVLLIISVQPFKALVFVTFFLVLQQIEGNVIYPRVVGNSVGLPGIWVLVAITVGGGLFGIIGMLVFVPIVSVIYTLLKKDVNSKLQEKNINVV